MSLLDFLLIYLLLMFAPVYSMVDQAITWRKTPNDFRRYKI